MKLSNVFSRKNRILLTELVKTDFKLRYEASALGYLWSVVSPLLLFTVLYIVFDKFLGFGRNIEHYPVYLLLGIVLWRFFVEATTNGLKAIVQRGSLIRKINFPKYIVVFSGTISSLINLAINLVIVLIFMLFNGVDLSWNALLIVPLLIELYIFALAVAFFLATANVFLRDVSYLWDMVTQVLFYATPIIYPIALVSSKSVLAAQILLTNPAAQVIQDARYVLVTNQTETLWSLSNMSWIVTVPFAVILVTSALAVYYFRSQSKRFAEFV